MNWKSRAALSTVAAAALVTAGLAVSPALASTTAPVVSGGGLHPVAVAFSNSGSTAYVIDQNEFIHVVTTSTKKVAHTIYTDAIATSGFESGGALSPDGKDLFVAVYNNPSGPQLLEYSTSTRKLVRQLSLGGELTGAVAVTPDGTKVLVWGETNEETPHVELNEVLLSTGVVTPIVLGDVTGSSSPTAVVVSSDSGTAYVTTQSDTVAVVDLGTSDVAPISTEGKPEGLALSHNDSTLYIAESDGSIEDAMAGSSSASSFVVLDGFQANALSLTPVTNKYLVITGSDNTTGNGYALVFSPATGDFVSQTTVGNSPWSVAVSPTGTKAYVGNNGAGTTSIVTLKDAAPAIASHTAPATGTVGTDYSTAWKATGFPSPTYTSTGTLPPGLTLNPQLGLVSGDPTTAGVYKFKVVANNSSGKSSSSKTQTVTIKLALSPNEVGITGTPTSGQTLTAVTDPWGPGTVKLTYKWYRSSGSSWKAISGATKSTYKLTSSDKNHQVYVVITGTESGYTTVSEPSNPVAVS